MKLRDIAKEAGVSLTTVSLVLNGKGGVGAEKRRQVEQLLRKNGYQPLSFGEARRQASVSGNIYFLKYNKHSFAEHVNPGFASQIMDAAEKECRSLGYHLLVANFDDSSGADLPSLLAARNVKGVLLQGTFLEKEDAALLASIRVPLVVVDNGIDRLPVSAVTMHNFNGIRSAVDHLVGLGHTEIGFLSSNLPCNNDRARKQAFEESVRRHGLVGSAENIFPLSPTMEQAKLSMLEFLSAGVKLPTALVANNDSIAIGALQAFREKGIRVPDDISLTGFDGLPFSEVSDPPLTTVSVPLAEIGRCAVKLLHEHMLGHATTWNKMWLGTELIVRGSTAPVKK